MDKIIYYVYYRFNGSIVAISPTKEQSIHPFVTIDEAGGRLFIDAVCDIHDYLVDPSVDYPIVKRILDKDPRGIVDFLPIVSNQSTNKIIIAPNNVTFVFDQRDQIIGRQLFDCKQPLIIWITRKDLPDHFLEEVSISAQELIRLSRITVARTYSDCDVSAYTNYLVDCFNLEINDGS